MRTFLLLLLSLFPLAACGHGHYSDAYYYSPPYYEECICDPFGCDCWIVYYKLDDPEPDAVPGEVW